MLESSGRVMTEPLFEAKNFRKYFTVKKSLFSIQKSMVKAVDDINFKVYPNDVFGIVGESGCGKTTVLKALLLLHELTSGELLFKGKDVTKMNRKEINSYKSKVQTVMQDPYSSLSPRLKIRDIISEPIKIHTKLSREQINARVEELLLLVKLGKDAADYYPHEFSGGQRQRIAIARAIGLYPELILLDEPVSALDVSVQAQLMNELMDLHDTLKLTYIVVAHNLAVIRFMCNRMMVMYLGQIVEYGSCEDVFEHQLHPYTQALFKAALTPDPLMAENAETIQGEIPSPIDPPSGCHFHTRCPFATDLCSQEEPATESIGEDHVVKCHHWKQIVKNKERQWGIDQSEYS